MAKWKFRGRCEGEVLGYLPDGWMDATLRARSAAETRALSDGDVRRRSLGEVRDWTEDE
jgi:hypothetical protein